MEHGNWSAAVRLLYTRKRLQLGYNNNDNNKKYSGALMNNSSYYTTYTVQQCYTVSRYNNYSNYIIQLYPLTELAKTKLIIVYGMHL